MEKPPALARVNETFGAILRTVPHEQIHFSTHGASIQRSNGASIGVLCIGGLASALPLASSHYSGMVACYEKSMVVSLYKRIVAFLCTAMRGANVCLLSVSVVERAGVGKPQSLCT